MGERTQVSSDSWLISVNIIIIFVVWLFMPLILWHGWLVRSSGSRACNYVFTTFVTNSGLDMTKTMWMNGMICWPTYLCCCWLTNCMVTMVNRNYLFYRPCCPPYYKPPPQCWLVTTTYSVTGLASKVQRRLFICIRCGCCSFAVVSDWAGFNVSTNIV